MPEQEKGLESRWFVIGDRYMTSPVSVVAAEKRVTGYEVISVGLIIVFFFSWFSWAVCFSLLVNAPERDGMV